MPRIVGIDIPDHLKLEYALRAIQGIGKTNVYQLISIANVDPNKRAKQLTDEEVARIQKALDNFLYGGDLKRQIAQNITRLKNINSYRGYRHRSALPARGQRTRTNARTKRGKRVTVGAFKKSEIAKGEQQSKQKDAGK